MVHMDAQRLEAPGFGRDPLVWELTETVAKAERLYLAAREAWRLDREGTDAQVRRGEPTD